MNVQLIDKSSYREMPWANGNGVTTELFVRVDETSGRFLWRLSIAGVATNGPFSHFDRYDRVLTLLEGSGLVLNHGNGTAQTLNNIYAFAAFPGDVETHAILIDGPVRDFNVIADRDTFAPVVTIAEGSQCTPIAAKTQVLAVYAADGAQLVTGPDNVSYPLPERDLLLVDAPQTGEWTVSGTASIIVKLLEPEHVLRSVATNK